jgi:formylglycine-generating enzyme required for sulfatase activity
VFVAALGAFVVLPGLLVGAHAAEPPVAPAAATPATLPQPPASASPTPHLVAGSARINPVDGAAEVYIPPGPFPMGDQDMDDNPRHTVTLSGYWIYQEPVTVAMYRKFCAATGRRMPSKPYWGWWDDHPIVNVTWADARAYSVWAGVSLPSEAQWEKAARGTDGRKFPWGNDFDAGKLWSNVGGEKEGTSPVGDFPSGASPYGVLDMAGNVAQWCLDAYDTTFWTARGGRANRIDPVNDGANARWRVVRGGSWDASEAPGPFYLRSAFRGRSPPDNPDDYYGFRCVAVESDSDMPVVGSAVRPEMPADLTSRKFRSPVIAEFTVHVDGSCDARLLRTSGDAEIDAIVLDALCKWHWKPAMDKGSPIETKVKQEVDISVK